MSDTNQGSDEVDTGKHGGARQQAEAAERAYADGDDTKASDLLDEAMRTDPEGLANALQDDGPSMPGDEGVATDEEVAAISRQVEPRSDAPSRAGITGSGSGADGMGE